MFKINGTSIIDENTGKSLIEVSLGMNWYEVALPKFPPLHRRKQLNAQIFAEDKIDVASGSDIKSCNKIDKPPVIYRFSNIT